MHVNIVDCVISRVFFTPLICSMTGRDYDMKNEEFMRVMSLVGVLKTKKREMALYPCDRKGYGKYVSMNGPDGTWPKTP